MDAEVAQLERSKNKCYTSAFRYIYRLIGYIKSFTKMIDFGTTFIRILHLLFFFFFFFFFFFIFFYFLFLLLFFLILKLWINSTITLHVNNYEKYWDYIYR